MTKKRLTGIARKLRRDMTDAERRLWSRIRMRQLDGVKFSRQIQIDNFVVDFVCRRLKLVIELDGGQHSDSTADAVRTEIIEAHGYKVIRFWNNDVLENTEGVLEAILTEIAFARNER